MHVSTINLGGHSTLTAATVLARGVAVRFTSGQLALAGDSDTDAIAVVAEAVEEDAVVTFEALTPGRQVTMKSAVAFSAPCVVFAAASGKCDDSGTVRRGIALQSAGGADVLVLVLVC